MDLVGIAAIITSLTGVGMFLLTAWVNRRRNTIEHEANRAKTQEVFDDLKFTIMANHAENAARLNALTVNQDIMFNMVADLDQKVAKMANTSRKVVVLRSKELVGVK